MKETVIPVGSGTELAFVDFGRPAGRLLIGRVTSRRLRTRLESVVISWPGTRPAAPRRLFAPPCCLTVSKRVSSLPA